MECNAIQKHLWGRLNEAKECLWPGLCISERNGCQKHHRNNNQGQFGTSGEVGVGSLMGFRLEFQSILLASWLKLIKQWILWPCVNTFFFLLQQFTANATNVDKKLKQEMSLKYMWTNILCRGTVRFRDGQQCFLSCLFFVNCQEKSFVKNGLTNGLCVVDLNLPLYLPPLILSMILHRSMIGWSVGLAAMGFFTMQSYRKLLSQETRYKLDDNYPTRCSFGLNEVCLCC